MKGTHGELELEVPRDRDSTFKPVLVEKNSRRLTAMDDQILALYAKGMTTRDIAATFKELYGADVSHSLISQVTTAVSDQVKSWQERPLDPIYPIVYLDCIVVKVHDNGRVIRKSVYLALGVNIEGMKELLGMWISETEGSKFWLSVLSEIKNRGVENFYIVCTDGLAGFDEAIGAVFPKAMTQTCIVHVIRNSLKYVPHKHKKEAAADLKAIYNAPSATAAADALADVEAKWFERYPSMVKTWQRQWDRIIPFLAFPQDLRKVIYTTNAIESLNSVIRKAIKLRKMFPNDDSVFRTLFLAINKASERWTMPIRDWPAALNHFELVFESDEG